MSVALTDAGTPTPDRTLPPLVLSEFEPMSKPGGWLIGSFQITAWPNAAVESVCCAPNSVRATYSCGSTSEDFFLRTFLVSEPGTLALLAIGLGWLAFARRCKQQLVA